MVRVGMWINSQDLLRDGVDPLFSKLGSYGFDSASLFVGAGKLIFEPDKTLYGTMAPVHDPGLKGKDLLREACRGADDHGIGLTATAVCFPDEYHAQSFPQYAAQDVSGARHENFLCPNRAEVRDYLRNLMQDMCARYEVDAIELDYVRYKRNREGSELPVLLLAGKYCYCEACRAKAEASGLDWKEVISSARLASEAAEKVDLDEFRKIGELYRNALDIVRFYVMYPALAKWLRFRVDTISSFVAEIKDELKSAGRTIELSADLFYPTLSWIVGQDYEQLSGHLDSAKPMIYSAAMGGWETGYLRSLYKGLGGGSEGELIEFLDNVQGFSSGASSFAELEVEGAHDQYVLHETRKARLLLGDRTRLYTGLSSGWVPGVRFSTPVRVKYDIDSAVKAGSDGLWFFSYGSTSEEIFETIKNSVAALR